MITERGAGLCVGSSIAGAVEDVPSRPGAAEEVVRRAEVDGAGLVQPGALVVGTGHVKGVKVVLKLEGRTISEIGGRPRDEQHPGRTTWSGQQPTSAATSPTTSAMANLRSPSSTHRRVSDARSNR
jgi:hypothetical protein